MTGSHRSPDGIIRPCGATKNPCKFIKTSPHFSKEEYEEMVNNNDPLIKTVPKKFTNLPYFVEAQHAYQQEVEEDIRVRTIRSHKEETETKLRHELGLTVEDLETDDEILETRDYSTLQNKISEEYRTTQQFTDEEINTIVQYVDLNTGRLGTHILVQEHPNLSDRLNSTYNQIAASENVESARQNLINGVSKAKLYYKGQYQRDIIRAEIDIEKKFGGPESRTNEEALYPNLKDEKYSRTVRNYKDAYDRAASGIPEHTTLVPASFITADTLSADEKGNINNLWYENRQGEYERVLHYNESSSETFTCFITNKDTVINKTANVNTKFIMAPPKGRKITK